MVLGATGRQGGAVARELLRRGYDVRALVRNPDAGPAQAVQAEGASLVRGDFEDASSLLSAMQDCAGVFSVQTFRGPGGAQAEERQGKAVADAAAKAGVGHFVYSSVGGAERDSGIPHFESKWRIECHIAEIQLPATVLRPVMFHEIFEEIGPRPVDGHLQLGLWMPPELPVQMIAVADIAKFAADAFDSPGTWLGRQVEIAGDELTGPQMAQAFAAVCGRPVNYVPLSIEKLRIAREDLARMFDWFQADGYHADLPALRNLRSDLIPLQAWLAEHWTSPGH
nr:NmrA/HSCARG family protein [Kineosporia babensis]